MAGHMRSMFRHTWRAAGRRAIGTGRALSTAAVESAGKKESLEPVTVDEGGGAGAASSDKIDGFLHTADHIEAAYTGTLWFSNLFPTQVRKGHTCTFVLSSIPTILTQLTST